MAIAEIVLDLIQKLVEIGAAAIKRNDPEALRRVRDVIDGELETERVIREGEERARRLEGGS